MEEKLDYEDFKPLFGAWAEKFRPFIESKEMYDIYQKLKSEKEIIVPNSASVFRAFSLTRPDSIRSIWYLMDPYPRRYAGRAKINQATGVAMDCSNSPDGKIQPSLEKFYDAISKELGDRVVKSPDLTYLLDQGILLLNTDLTCKLNKTGSHEGLWEPFQKFFLEEVMRGTKDIIYVLCGKDSKRMKKFINPLGNTIVELDHPAFADRTHTDWNSKGVFKMINKSLAAEGKEPILWDKRVYDTEWVPF